MAKTKKDLSGTLEADLREWVDVDVDELEEEELVKKYAKISAFEDKIGYGTKCIFVKNVLDRYWQVIKTETDFLFHYLGKQIYKDNCISANQYIDIDNLEKKDFLINRNNIKEIILDKRSPIYSWRKLIFKLKKGISKSFVLYEQMVDFNYKNFFGENFKIRTQDQRVLDKMLNGEGIYQSYDQTFMSFYEMKDELEDASLETKIKAQQVDEMLTKKYEFTLKIGYGEKCVFLTTLSKEFVQVIKTKTHFVFHYLGQEINPNNCFYSTQDYDIRNLKGEDFVIDRKKIKKIILRHAHVHYGKYDKIKFKIEGENSKTFIHDVSYGIYSYSDFWGKNFKSKNSFWESIGDFF